MAAGDAFERLYFEFGQIDRERALSAFRGDNEAACPALRGAVYK